MNGELKNEVKKSTIGYVMTAFGLVAGLAWNDAIRSLIEFVFPFSGSGMNIWAKFLYAALVTLVVILIGVYVLKTTESSEK